MRGLSFFTAKRGGGMARKTKYDTHVLPNLEMIPRWRRQGLGIDEVAKKLGVAKSTLHGYAKENIELSNALKKGKEELINELENALYKRALGFEYEETKDIMTTGKDGMRARKKEITKKFVAPDVGAIAFALKNLDKNNWKDRPLVEEMEKLKEEMTRIEKEKMELENERTKLQSELIKTKTELLKGYGQEIEDLSEVEELIYGTKEEKDD